MQNVTILGSTGSIGVSTLSVIEQHPDQFNIVALTAYHHVDRLFTQCMQFQPDVAVMVDAKAAATLSARLKEKNSKTTVLAGSKSLSDIAGDSGSDVVVAAIVGAAGLLPTLSAVKAGKRVLLANKEALVMSGGLFMQAVRDHGATLLPVDSEHNAILQCLASGRVDDVSSMVLTASGGPFRTLPVEQLDAVTPAQAVAHPNWSMGAKISVDSATMMNKGLEVVEACWLFGFPRTQIDVMIHPQSVVHALVHYCDGSVLAQMGQPDMRTPIAHALAWPERIAVDVAPLDLVQLAQLDFCAVDLAHYPCLRLVYEAMDAGDAAVCALNAANEVAVAAFLQGDIAYTAIPEIIDAALQRIDLPPLTSIDDALHIDHTARQLTKVGNEPIRRDF